MILQDTFELKQDLDFYRSNIVVIWGIEKYSDKILSFLEYHNVDVYAFCDNDKNRWGNKYAGKNIISPEELKLLSQQSDKKVIVQIANDINISNYNEVTTAISQQLINLGIEHIVPMHELSDIKYMDKNLNSVHIFKHLNTTAENCNNILQEFYNDLEDEQSKKILEKRIDFYFNEKISNQKALDDLKYYISKNCYKYLNNSREENFKTTLKHFIDNCVDKIFKDSPILFYGIDNEVQRIFTELYEDKEFYNEVLDGREILFFTKDSKTETTCCNFPVINLDMLTNEHIEKGIFIFAQPNLDDNISVRLFLKNKNVEMTRMRHALSFMDKEEQYFDEEIIKFQEDEVFVDVGVLNAETSLKFIEKCNGKYENIYLFEPNKDSYKVSDKNLQLAKVEKYKLFPVGLSDKKDILIFSGSGGLFSSVIDRQENYVEIPVDSLDNQIGDSKVTFIKMDIEGAELKALYGCKNAISKYKPKLAISIYHKVEDLFEIQQYIKSLVPEYKFYLRHYTTTWGDTILYAVL